MTTEMKHTPGPWTAVPQYGTGPMIAHVIETGEQMKPTRMRLIAHSLERGNSLLEDQANARLIVAAPDLLEALKILAIEFQFAERDEVTEKVYVQVYAAIAKAEGRQ